MILHHPYQAEEGGAGSGGGGGGAPDVAALAAQVADLTAKVAAGEAAKATAEAAATAAAEAAKKAADDAAAEKLTAAEKLAKEREEFAGEVKTQREQLKAERKQAAAEKLGIIGKALPLTPDVDVATPEGLATLEKWAKANPEFVTQRAGPVSALTTITAQGGKVASILAGNVKNPFITADSMARMFGDK